LFINREKEKEDKEKIEKEKNKNINLNNEKGLEIKKNLNKNKTNVSLSNSSISSRDPFKDPFDDYLKVVKCRKLVPNKITDREDLYITISDSQRVKSGFFLLFIFNIIFKPKTTFDLPCFIYSGITNSFLWIKR